MMLALIPHLGGREQQLSELEASTGYRGFQEYIDVARAT